MAWNVGKWEWFASHAHTVISNGEVEFGEHPSEMRNSRRFGVVLI